MKIAVLALVVAALLALATAANPPLLASSGGGVVTSQTAGYTNAVSAESEMVNENGL